MIVDIGGAILGPDGLESSEPTSKMIGSMLVVRAENLTEARKLIEADIYWTAGVVGPSCTDWHHSVV